MDGEQTINGYTGVKVFSATKARERDGMGAAISRWVKQHSDLEIVEKIITQSSDKEFHCYTMTLFYREKE
jgi:hypothetical protein